MLKSPSLHVGDTVFYVLEDESPRFRIRKTRIVEVTKQRTMQFLDKYCYRCKDGYHFDSVEYLRPCFVFHTRKETLAFVVERLRSSLEYEKNDIVTTRQHLEQLQASLRVYTAASNGHENSHANLTYAYYIDDDDDRYVIRKTSLKRIFGDLGPGADFNALGCRDMGNGVLLSHICRTKEQAAYRITQFLLAEIARQEMRCANAEARLSQTQCSLNLYQHYLKSE